MKRSTLEPKRYDYLSELDSVLYDLAENKAMTLDEACTAIKSMLEDKASMSRANHVSSRY